MPIAPKLPAPSSRFPAPSAQFLAVPVSSFQLPFPYMQRNFLSHPISLLPVPSSQLPRPNSWFPDPGFQFSAHSSPFLVRFPAPNPGVCLGFTRCISRKYFPAALEVRRRAARTSLPARVRHVSRRGHGEVSNPKRYIMGPWGGTGHWHGTMPVPGRPFVER